MELAIEFTGDMSFQDYLNDEKTQFAVIRCLELIGEATKRLSDEIRKQDSDIPWKAMSGMRDRLIHAYDSIDIELVWKTARETLPKVLKDIGKLRK